MYDIFGARVFLICKLLDVSEHRVEIDSVSVETKQKNTHALKRVRGICSHSGDPPLIYGLPGNTGVIRVGLFVALLGALGVELHAPPRPLGPQHKK